MQTGIVFLIGAGLFLLGYFQRRKVGASQSWPAAMGTVVAGEVQRSVTRGDEDTSDSVTFTPRVTYEYTADGAVRRGNRMAFVERAYSNAKAAQTALAAYPVGAQVAVYYNPAKPGEAVLERKASGGMLVLALGGGIMALAVAALIKG